MEEVDNLNQSIREYCPEIIGTDHTKPHLQAEDEMSALIEHRIKLLTQNAARAKKLESK